MRTYPMGDMRDRCNSFDGHCGDQICRTDCFTRIKNAEGNKITPRPLKHHTPPIKKYKSKMHKKMHKFEVAFDKALGKPLELARINKSAEALNKKIEAAK